jgi:tetratricopeptide (TPR) repeat protein
MVLLVKSDLPGARKAFEEALSISPKYTAPALGLALLAAKEGSLGEAIKSLEKLALDRPPEDEESFLKGVELLRNGSWEEAEPLLLRAFHQADRDLAEAKQRIGQHLDGGRPLEALEQAQAIVDRFPSYPDAHHFVGLSCLALEWWDDAIEAFARALRWNSEFHEARVYLACVLFARGESARAESELARVLRADPEHAAARRLLDERGSVAAAEGTAETTSKPAAPSSNT